VRIGYLEEENTKEAFNLLSEIGKMIIAIKQKIKS